MASLRDPEKIEIIVKSCETTITFVVQSLCGGKIQGVSEVLTRGVSEAGPSPLAVLKLSLAVCSPETDLWVMFVSLMALPQFRWNQHCCLYYPFGDFKGHW